MLTQAERRIKNSLYTQKPVPWTKITSLYEGSNYDQACVFRRYTTGLGLYEKRKCFELMDEIDRKFYFKESPKDSIKKICDLLGLDENNFKNLI